VLSFQCSFHMAEKPASLQIESGLVPENQVDAKRTLSLKWIAAAKCAQPHS
jgi:hypothetical protein